MFRNRLAAPLLPLLLAACAIQTPPDAAAPPAAGPAPDLRLPAVPGGTDWQLVPGESEVRVLVYRAGALSGLGHNHVVSSERIRGRIRMAEEITSAHFALAVPLESFRVDLPAERAAAGADFRSEPDAQAIRGTRANMLGPQVLDAGRFPWLTVQGAVRHGPEWLPGVHATIRLHGESRTIEVPVALHREAGRLLLTGHFTLRQSDFGIQPLSILGGAIQVRDEFRVLFRLVAQPAGRE